MLQNDQLARSRLLIGSRLPKATNHKALFEWTSFDAGMKNLIRILKLVDFERGAQLTCRLNVPSYHFYY